MKSQFHNWPIPFLFTYWVLGSDLDAMETEFMTDKTSAGRLPGGRQIRAMDGNFTQAQIFQLPGKIERKTEHVALMKDIDDALGIDDALNAAGIYPAIMGDRWVRTGEYCFYNKDPETPLGREIIWVEGGVRYRISIPDVPVRFCGKKTSLQKVTGGMGVFDSIELLQMAQTGEKEFTVSPTNPTALEGKVRAVRFMNNGWAQTDGGGLPDAGKPASPDDPAARYGWMRAIFGKGATGWHGSFARGVGGDGGRSVVADFDWSNLSGVAIVGCNPRTGKSVIK